MSETVKISVNGTALEVPAGMTILQACEAAGVEIPRFCYHERLSVAGNCRMCLVEVEKNPKPIASCAMPVAPDMAIHTDTNTVKAARTGVMEFLLINHPLDCPICDQGGECDLQDQAFGYGFDQSRFADNKRAVEDKEMGPLVKTIMTRCIHCTRCVRFATEVAGVPEIGAIGRGEDMEITTYLEAALESELSGNVIDLCPVGALTSKPYAFTARPWELRKTETIDVMDALGAHIRVDMRGREAMRILPRPNEAINEEWLSDKSRFVWDGLNSQRLDCPYIKTNGTLAPCTWADAFATIKARLDGKADKTAAIAGDLVCAEGQFALKQFMQAFGSPHLECRQDGAQIMGGRGNYIFNSGIAGIERADALLIVGSNPRLEAPVLNARIRKRWRMGDFPIAAIGTAADLTYPTTWLGTTPSDLRDLLAGKHGFYETLKAAKHPMIIIGQGAVARSDGAAVLRDTITLAEQVGAITAEWIGFNMLHTAAARVAGLELGLVPQAGGRDLAGILAGCGDGAIENIILYGADELDMAALGQAFVVYIGSHGDAGAGRADVILPAASYTEKQAIYVNTEGRPQMTERAAFPPGDARTDWKIFRAMGEACGLTLNFDSLEELRAQIYKAAPHLADLDCLPPSTPPSTKDLPQGEITQTPFTSTIHNFYFTNPIARASAIMASCDKSKKQNQQARAS